MADQTPAPADSYPDAGGGQAPIANGDSAKKRKRLDHNPGGELGSKEIIFARQLAEVYLLIDNVTNFPNKHMPPAPANDPQYAAVFGKHGDWLSQICSIPWPPHVEAEDDESDDDASKMAARLFLARDILNNAAEPANGMTIAFTQAVLEMRRSTRTAPEELYPESKELNSTSLGQALASDRMAFIAYPSLAHEAQKFNNSVSLLNRFVIFFAIFTFVVSWQVGSGSALLANVASARDNYAGANQAIDTAMQYGSIASTGGPAPTPPARPVRGRGPIKAIAAVPAPTTTISTGPTDPAIFCGNPSPIGNAARGQEIARRKLCADLNDRSASLIVAERDLEQWNERQDHGWSAGGAGVVAQLARRPGGHATLCQGVVLQRCCGRYAMGLCVDPRHRRYCAADFLWCAWRRGSSDANAVGQNQGQHTDPARWSIGLDQHGAGQPGGRVHRPVCQHRHGCPFGNKPSFNVSVVLSGRIFGRTRVRHA